MQHTPNKEWMWGIYLYNKHKQGYINWTCMTFSKGFIMGKTEWRTHSSHILLIHICNILHTFRYFSITLISFRIYNKYYLNRRGINYRVHTLKHVMWTSEDRQIHYIKLNQWFCFSTPVQGTHCLAHFERLYLTHLIQNISS